MNSPLKITLISLGALAGGCALIVGLSWNSPRMALLRHRLFSREAPVVEEFEPYRRPYHGSIFAQDGVVLAQDRVCFDLYLKTGREYSTEELRKLARKLAYIKPEKTAGRWWETLKEVSDSGTYYKCIAKGLSEEALGYVCGEDETLIRIVQRHEREYPCGELARRTIGYVLDGDRSFKVGLEGKYEDRMYRGWNSQPQSLQTTLDMDIQAAADEAFRSKVDSTVIGACFVLMEVESGAIRAMVNLHRALDGRIGEYYNYAIGYSYEAGAPASPMTYAAALCDHVSWSGNPPVEKVVTAYNDSPEYFIQSLKEMTLEGHTSEFDIVGLREPDFPSPKSVNSQNDLAALARGFSWTLTPLHLLAFYNMVAGDGVKRMPYLVEGFYDGETLCPCEHNPLEGGIGGEVAAELASILKANPHFSSALSGSKVQIVGMSGVSQQVLDPCLRKEGFFYEGKKGEHKYASTFVGYFPADEPKYSVVCAVFTDTVLGYPPVLSVPVQVVRELAELL